MDEIGTVLRRLRKENNYSLKDVYRLTGISDSRLSRIENNDKSPSIEDVKRLSLCYSPPLFSLLKQSGYISMDSLSTAERGFQDIPLLSEEEYEHIQHEIDIFTRERK